MRFLLFLVLSPFSLPAQHSSADDLRNIKAAVTGMFEGLAELNAEKIKPYITADFLLLESGEIWNMDTIEVKLMQSKKRYREFKRVNSFDFFRWDIHGNTAWISFFNQADIMADGVPRKVKWLESAVLVRKENQWKIQLFHSSLLKAGK